MASIYKYNRNIRSGRSQRKRYDSEDENITLDWDKPLNENLQEILYHITRKEGVNKGQRLAYLNCFTKFCLKVKSINAESCGLTIDEIFCCIRVALFHEAGEVRAAGLRAMRYLLRDEESVESFCSVNLPLLICRSIDIVLDNRLERIQALRLVRQLLSLNPKRFPSAITHCLVSIAKDGIQERDMLVRACWATIAELTVMNPTASAAAGGLSAIIKSVLQSNQTHNISEALISSILFLLNSPKTRSFIRSDLDLQHFIAPFTDVHGFGGEYCDSHEQKVCRYTASKNAILSIMRSWSGLIFMCRVSNNVYEHHIPNGIESLINMLHLPYIEIQRYIMEVIFELFYLPIPDWTDDFEDALISSDPSTMQDNWQLYDGFVAAEGKSILPFITKNRLNLLTNYLGLLLHSFVNYGLIEALVSVIIDSSESCCSVTATILLGELLYLSSCILPSDCAHRCQSLPTLMASSFSSSPKKRELSNAAVSNLSRIHELKKRGPIPCSLYLDQLLRFCQPSVHNNLINKLTKSKLKTNVRKNADEAVIQSIKTSQVLKRDFNDWNWDLIQTILKYPGDALRKLDDNNHKVFIKKLLQFYKPSSKQFSQVISTDHRFRIMTTVGQHFLDFILDSDEHKNQEYIEEFFVDLDNCFSQISVETPPQNAILSPGRLLSTLSHSYFLFIGRLTNSNKGRKWLEKTGIFQYFLDLISLSSHDVYMKLIVSSLDYSNEVNNFSRTLLTKVLTCQSESSRLYATNYLRVLLRSGVCDFSKWAVELLVLQLYDKASAVSLAAMDVLDEACDCVENLEALISLRPSLLHIGDNGLLLLVRYLSLESGFKFLRDANFIDYELNRWQKSFNLKYVKIVEDLLNESFTCHQRNEDGTYGRRSEKKSALPKSTFIPPHLYGQLSNTSEGYELLLKEDCLSDLYNVIRSPDFSTELGCVRLKAALWAVGHVGSTYLGFQLINETETVPIIIEMASNSPILSIRGTCFCVLSLIATTVEGSELLKEFGWDSIRHSHHEKFVLVEQPNADSLLNFFNEKRTHTWSMSSASTKLFDIISGTDFDYSSSNLFVTHDFHDSEEQTYRGSLPALNTTNDKVKAKKISLPSTRSPKIKVLPRVLSLSPNHYRIHCTALLTNNNDSRPRASSDCPNIKKPENKGLDTDESDSVSGIWIKNKSNESIVQNTVSFNDIDRSLMKPERHDSGLIADAVCSPSILTIPKTSTLTVQHYPKRKTSEPFGAFYGSFARDERSDSNESSHNSSGKSRSGSFAESTSGVSASSCDSSSQIHNMLRKRNNLSPIASLSSISNSTQSTAFKSILSSSASGNALPLVASKSFIVHHSGHEISNITESIPSAIDAHGYATLRAIQKRRVQSLSGSMFSEHNSEETDETIKESHDSVNSQTVKDSSDSSEERSTSPSTDDRKFMGLSLPINLALIFQIESEFKPIRKMSIRNPMNGWKTHLDKLSVEQQMFNNGLEFHNQTNCLYCFRQKLKNQITCENDTQIASIQTQIQSLNKTKQLIVEREIPNLSSSASSIDSTINYSLKTPTNDTSNIPNQILNRREILRFVTNLSGAVHAKQAEQGLLNLKQKCPQAFEDICLYSEISLQLSNYNFRMSARRFLQELFLDVYFEQIFSEADSIIRRLSGQVVMSSNTSSSVTVEADNGVS